MSAARRRWLPRLPRAVWAVLWSGLGVFLLAYAVVWGLVWQRASEAFEHPPQRPADAALILGNRAYLKGKPNPCLTGRVDAGLALAHSGGVKQLVFSGGVDQEDGRIEAEVMEQHARATGYTGPMLLERVSSSTRQNLALSRPLLQAAGVRSVVIVSEPYHLWRTERLVRMSGFDRDFDVQYAPAVTSCWRNWGMAFKGALREPFAIVNNASRGFLF